MKVHSDDPAVSTLTSSSGGADDWTGLVIVCGGAAWGDWYPSEKHIAMHLSKKAPILFVDPPSSSVPRQPHDRLGRPGLRVVSPSLAVLSLKTLPGQSRPYVARLTRSIARRGIARAVAALGVDRAGAMIVANHVDLFGAVEADLDVVYATDDFVAGAELLGMDRDFLMGEERRQAAHADRVVVVTERLAERWERLGHDPILIPNGCDTEQFRDVESLPLPPDVDLPAPRVGVFGHLSNRIDISLLEAVAARGISLLLIGTRQPSFSIDSLLAHDNVRYLGTKPFEAMPAYLGCIDVGLTPYADIEFNRASFPLKTLEYLAGGRGAVSTDLPAVRWLDTDLISTATAPEAFADAVEAAIAQPRTTATVERRRAFARRHSWEARAAQFATVLGLDSDGDQRTSRVGEEAP